MEKLESITLRKTTTNGYKDLEIDLNMVPGTSVPSAADPTKTTLHYSIGLVYGDNSADSPFVTKFGAGYLSQDNYIAADGGIQYPRVRYQSLESWDMGGIVIGTQRTGIKFGLDKQSIMQRFIRDNIMGVSTESEFNNLNFDVLGYIDSKAGAQRGSPYPWNQLTDEQRALWAPTQENYNHLYTGPDDVKWGDMTIDEYESWAYSDSLLGDSSTGSGGEITIQYYDSAGVRLKNPHPWGAGAGSGSSSPGSFKLVLQNGDVIYNTEDPAAFLNPASIPSTATITSLGSFSTPGVASITTEQLKTVTPHELESALRNDFGQTYAGNNTCSSEDLSQITAADLAALKKRYIVLASANNNQTYMDLRSSALNVTTVTTHALGSQHVLSMNLQNYQSGLKQYKMVVDDSNFPNASASQILTEVAMGFLNDLLKIRLINLSSGIGSMTTDSVVAAIDACTSPEVNATETLPCYYSLITDNTTRTIHHPAGVHSNYVQKFIDMCAAASDGGEHIATMLDNLVTAGGFGNITANSMIHVSGDTMYIGLRRAILENQTVNTGTNYPTGNPALIDDMNAIADELILKASNKVKQSLTESEL